MAGDHRGVEPFNALLEIPAVRTSRCVFRHGLFQNSAGIAIGSCQECRSLGTGSGTGPPPQQRDDPFDKVIFIPTGHFNWGVPVFPSEALSVNRPLGRALICGQSTRRRLPSTFKTDEGAEFHTCEQKNAPCRGTALSALRERPFRLSPEHSPAVLNVGFHRTDCQSGPLCGFLVRETFDFQL